MLRALWIALWLVAAGMTFAQVPVPALTGHVIDLSGTLTPTQQITLEHTLTTFEARKGSQLAILLLPSTAPETIEAFALRVAEQWRLGRAAVDDGAIVIIATQDRVVRIEVGYSLEGVLSDAVSHRIINDSILPHFRQQDIYGGISAGVVTLMRVLEGESLPAPAPTMADAAARMLPWLPLLVMLTLLAGGVLRAMLGSLPAATLTGGLAGGIVWLGAGTLGLALLAGLAACVLTLLGGNIIRHGVYGRYAGRHDHPHTLGGGLGHGGWGGGGGGFGGGGASGRW
jgi:uncharacterized protein